jgi:rhodanese-related sulfurtransferase
MESNVGKTFAQLVAEAAAVVPAVDPAEAQRRLTADPRTLIVDVRDPADVPSTGRIAGAITVSYATLPYKADQEVPPDWREPALQDRARPILTTCGAGPMGALGAKLLHDMGFSCVGYVEGGTSAWKDAGFPVE